MLGHFRYIYWHVFAMRGCETNQVNVVMICGENITVGNQVKLPHTLPVSGSVSLHTRHIYAVHAYYFI